MTDTYKATPECWEWQEEWASKEVPDEDSSCFLELRARVEALEAQVNRIPETIHCAIEDMPTVADPAPVTGGLNERVKLAIYSVSLDGAEEARAAILEVAKWLREQGTPASGWAMRLEQEAGR